MGWVVNVTTRPLYSRVSSCTHCTGYRNQNVKEKFDYTYIISPPPLSMFYSGYTWRYAVIDMYKKEVRKIRKDRENFKSLVPTACFSFTKGVFLLIVYVYSSFVDNLLFEYRFCTYHLFQAQFQRYASLLYSELFDSKQNLYIFL